MSQIALPLSAPGAVPSRIVTGSANAAVIEALGRANTWPFRTALLSGPPRSGKSLIARWFSENRLGDAVDDADRLEEAALFHRWNAAQESGTPLLVVSSRPPAEWAIALPDLRSRLGAAQPLVIGEPDDAMLAELIALHAQMRGFHLDETATAYLVPRSPRSHLGAETLVAAIDRLSLERKQPPTLGIWRDALEALAGESQPRLL